jgi:hypothetical protein
LIALEVWGFPTSSPAFDPGNRQFVYQRFQRGIMHYDHATRTTGGLLLGDWLKAVITGEGLPPDLAAQMEGSRFVRQYCPTNPPLALCRPDDLPHSNLSGAFEPSPGQGPSQGPGQQPGQPPGQPSPPLPPSPTPSVGPGTTPSPGTASSQEQQAVDASLEAAAAQLGVPRGQLRVLRVEHREWPSSALRCPQPGRFYTQVITPGYLVVIAGQAKELEYHTDLRGRAVLCFQR